MGKFCETDKEWFELLTRVLQDFVPLNVIADIAYLFAQTPDHQDSVLNEGNWQFRQDRTKNVGICGLDGIPPYPGAAAWRAKLIGQGVAPESVVLIEQQVGLPFPPSTDCEAVSLVRTAKRESWKTIFITSPPPHQIRAFLSTVGAMIKEGSELKIYNVVGGPVDWNKVVQLSQSVPPAPEREQLASELNKIIRYHAKGDLVSARESLDYLNRREIKEEK